MVRCGKIVSLVLMVSLFFTSAVYAQWIFLGRKAIGKISHLASEVQNNNNDVATVLLEAKADNVYNTAVTLLKGNENARITRRDDAARTIDFTYGQHTASMKIASLQDNVSQLIISSAVASGKPGDTSFVVDSVFRVCREMGVECGLAKD
ncbi:MAG: hypothetical protein NTX75_18280 [Proteobacteria bacterium]|nr:hypothetical protein [Pseudomonadota bacterium]